MEDRERQIEESRRRRFGARVPSFIRNFGAARQAKAANDALRRVLAHIGFKPGWHVIEFGAGDGAALQTFLDLGSPPDTLSGVEIQEGEAANGRARRGVDIRHCDATKEVPFPAATFDLAFVSTTFYEISDDEAQAMAVQMLRVVKPGSYIVVRDWTRERSGARPVTRGFVERCFGLPVMHVERGAMHQIKGRLIGGIAPALYDLAEPHFDGGMKLYVLQATPTAVM